jgi:hypothetical protein
VRGERREEGETKENEEEKEYFIINFSISILMKI